MGIAAAVTTATAAASATTTAATAMASTTGITARLRLRLRLYLCVLKYFKIKSRTGPVFEQDPYRSGYSEPGFFVDWNGPAQIGSDPTRPDGTGPAQNIPDIGYPKNIRKSTNSQQTSPP